MNPAAPVAWDAAPNSGMHPTANSVDLMRETPANQTFVAAGDAGRSMSSYAVSSD